MNTNASCSNRDAYFPITLEHLEEALQRVTPAAVKIDLYSHDPMLGLGDQCFEVDPELVFRWLCGKDRRRVLIVPEPKLEELAEQMRDAGFDVRVKPKLGT